jgi:hypothetical protein
MKKVLKKHWVYFVKVAREVGKPIYMSSFSPDNAHCHGSITGDPCSGDRVALKDLHVDHT